MSVENDRPVKRRWAIRIGRYTLNPVVRGMFKIGITPPGMVLVETIGRRTGAVRCIPVVCGPPDGDTLWLVAQHGVHAGWVRNFQENPRIRVRLRRRWRTGVAVLVPEDDVKARIRTFASNPVRRAMTSASFRALESQPVSVRIELSELSAT